MLYQFWYHKTTNESNQGVKEYFELINNTQPTVEITFEKLKNFQTPYENKFIILPRDIYLVVQSGR